MADVKISALSSAGALTGTEEVPVVQSGVTVKTTAQDIANLSSTTYAAINAALGLPTNSFLFSNNSSELVGYANWAVDPVTKFSNVNLTTQPNNLSQFPIAFNWYVNVDPLQNSPNDGVVCSGYVINLDSADSGFSFGTNGDAGQIHNGGFSYQGSANPSFGRLRVYNSYSNLGNGTDPFTFKGFNAASVGLTVAANGTVDGSVSGFDFNASINASAITTSNFSVSGFSDFSQLPVNVYGYQGVIIQPNISKIKNNTNFNGFTCNPTITDFEGNSGFFGFVIGGQITNQSASNGYFGGNINPNITHLTQNSQGLFVGCQTTDGTANWDGIALSTASLNTTGQVKALNIYTNAGHIAIDSTGHCNLYSGFQLVSSLGQQYGHVIGGEIKIDDDVTPATITGTDTLANNMAFTVNTGLAGSTWTAASLVGLTTLGFVGEIIGAGTCTGSVNFCLNGYADAHTGHIDQVNNFFAAAIPTGAGGTMDRSILYYGDRPAGSVATSEWGLRIDDSGATGMHNFLTKLALNTADKKSSGANVRLDLFDGHFVTGQTTAATVAANANAGTGASASLTTATDVAGIINLTTGSGAFSPGTQLTVSFNMAYDVAPVVLMCAANEAAIDSANQHNIYVGNVTTSGFDIVFGVQENNAGTVYKWNYLVIGV